MNEPRKLTRRDLHFSAEQLVVGEATDTKNGAIPVRLKARSKQPLDHWWFGRVVHDFSTMQHKEKAFIDRDHNEEVGYLDTFEVTDYGLEVAGMVTPVTDTARDVVALMQAGVPMEASIDFSADKIGIENVPEGASVTVNGMQFDGPITVIRNWPLRGVAICKAGYDIKTESALLSERMNQEVEVVNLTESKGESDMAEEKKDVEESAESVKDTVTDAPEKEEPVAPPQEEPAKDGRTEFKAMVARFGAERAAQFYAEGLSMADAVAKDYDLCKSELKAAREEIAKLKASGGSQKVVPSEVVGSETKNEKHFDGMTDAERKFAASIGIK